MTSSVLARKYRPKGFDSMVGQGHVVQALGNALTQQRLHHAYLFTGTRGVGKTTVSRILAKSLNCVGPDGQGGITASPCGQCQPCRDIDSGRFVDYVELDAASNRGVEEISQLLEQSVYKPVVGRFKVYLIDEVHMLSNTAFNAMLKTLEEPPDYLKFVLATTDPQKVPVTVLSRCLQFNLRPMAAETMQSHLAQVLATEGIAFDAGALRLLARAARGSMRDAMSLADQAIAFGNGGLEESAVRTMLGSVDRTHVERIVRAVAAMDGAGLVAAVDTLRELGLSAGGTLEELAAALQRMAVLQAVPQAVEGDDPDVATWHRLAPLLAPDETQLFYSLCLQGRAELALAPDEYSGLLMLLLRLLAFKPGQTRAGAAPPKALGSTAPPEAVEPSPAAVSPSRPVVAAQPEQASSRPTPEPVRVAGPSLVVAPAPPPPAPLRTQARPTLSEPPLVESLAKPPAKAKAASVPPWESLPPEADAAWGHGEPDAWSAPASRGADADPRPDPDAVEAASVSIEVPAQQTPASQRPAKPVASAVSLADVNWDEDALSAPWAQLVAEMEAQGAIAALVRELAIQSQCLRWERSAEAITACLNVERESLIAHRERLSAALSTHLGLAVSLSVDRGPATGTPAQRAQSARELQQRRAEDLIQNDALVQGLLGQFPGARLVAGSIRSL